MNCTPREQKKIGNYSWKFVFQTEFFASEIRQYAYEMREGG